MTTSLPPHGRISCSRCFDGGAIWNETERVTGDGWHIINNPMSWGSQAPLSLVLGVSKGTTQCDALKTKPHDQVPFDGFRPKMTEALRLLGLLGQGEAIEDKIKATEDDWAFGSMVRCALGLVDPQDGSVSRSGTVVQRLAAMNPDVSWLFKCSAAFLSQLPERLRICVLLSNDDNYIQVCRDAITRLRPSTRQINSVAYGDSQITWVHIIHVGGPGKNHITDWFAGNGTQGRKRADAQEAVSLALGIPLERAPVIAKEAGPPPERFRIGKSSGRAPAKEKGKGRPIPENKTRDAVLARIKARQDTSPHPDQANPHGTKYIAAFVTSNGTTFAVDNMNASKQPIWLLDAHGIMARLKAARVAFEYYAPDEGRNSNLHKLPGFKSGALLRVYPETVDEAMQVIDLLGEGGS